MFDFPATFAAVPPWFLTVVAAVVGSCIGSFLNVVIYRLPAGESVAHPRSHCACGQPIAWRDNLPVLSWFLLRGRARCCGRRFSWRYPAVEALTAALFVLCWWREPPLVALCGWVFVSVLIAATFIDLDHLIIPEVLTVGLGVAGIGLSLVVPALHGQHSGVPALDSLRSAAASLQGLTIGSGLVLWIAVVAGAVLKKEAMGMGDVIFVGGIGAFCGWHGAVFAVFGGAIVGAAALLVLAAIRGLRRPPTAPAAGPTAAPVPAPPSWGLGVQVPFGPMLAVAGAIYFVAGRDWVDAWFQSLAPLF